MNMSKFVSVNTDLYTAKPMSYFITRKGYASIGEGRDGVLVELVNEGYVKIIDGDKTIELDVDCLRKLNKAVNRMLRLHSV